MVHIILATGNQHKASEIMAGLGEGFRHWTLGDFPEAPAVVEDANTFAGNACKKAESLAAWWMQPPPSPARDSVKVGAEAIWVLADDSGLEVDALEGAPGVHSARFATLDQSGSRNASDDANNLKLLALLKNVPPPRRTARFRCVLALTPILSPSPLLTGEEPAATLVFEGVCEGNLLTAPRGVNGFGYDPLFVPQGQTRTFAELGEAIKNTLSHRARALDQLRTWFNPAPPTAY